MQFAGIGRMMGPRRGGVTTFDPASLFASGEDGLFYDPSDLSTLFQDVAGSTAVTSDGDPVARVNDKSGNGSNGLQSTDTKRPLYKAGAGLQWFQPDGVDDGFNVSGLDLAPGAGSQTWTICFAANSNSDAKYLWGADAVDASTYILAADSASADPTIVNAPMTLTSLHVDGVSASPATRAALHTVLAGAHVARCEIEVTAAVTWDAPVIFLFAGSAVFNYSGFAYSLIYINRSLTSEEAANVDAYLAVKAGVTL